MKKIFLSFTLAFLFAAASLADVSPWDAWRLGYTCFEQGEGFRDRGEYTQALKSFSEALEHYNSVRRARPDWNQKVIARRIADCEKECERMKSLLGDSEPTREEMAESGAAALRPTSQEVAKEIDDIRKQLSEARSELAMLRQKTSAQRNYEQEITQLLRDQRIARERYLLLERRYRDLDRASRQPDRRTQELNEQLLEEKMQSEQLKKQLALHERRRKSEEARFQASENRRRSLERQLGEKIAQLSRLDSESSGLRAFQKEAAEKLDKLNRQTAELQKQLAASEQDRRRENEELVRVKQQLVVANGRVSEIDAAVKKEQELREQLVRTGALRDELRMKLDSSLKEVEELKLKLIRLQVVESARQELEQNAEIQRSAAEGLKRELAGEKTASATLRKELAALRSQIEKQSAVDKINAENREKEIKRLLGELENAKNRNGVSEKEKFAALEKELASVRSNAGKNAQELARAKVEKEQLEKQNKVLSVEIADLRKQMASANAAATGELQAKLRAAEENAAKSRTLLEKDLAALTEKNKRDADILAARNEEIRKLNAELARRPAADAKSGTDELFAGENRKLQGEIRILKHQLQQRDSAIARSSSEIDEIRKQNEELVSAMQKMRSDAGKLTGDNAVLRSELERERTASGNVGAELQRMRELKAGIEQDLRSAVDRAERLEKRLSNRDSEDFKRLTASQEERKKLSDKVAELQGELARFKVDSDTFKQNNSALKRELDKINAEHTTVSAERDRLLEDRKNHLAAIGKLAGVEKKLETLRKDFAALQAENKENKLLVEAAKPREAELAQIKLRLTALDQLKAQLAKEQRLNEELKNANRKLESERGNAVILRSRLNNANKRIGELEPLVKEVSVLKKLNAELAVAKNLEAELANAKLQLNSMESVKLELDHTKQQLRKLELEKLESDRKAERAGNLVTGTQLLTAELEAAKKAADKLAEEKSLRELEIAGMRSRLNDIPRLEAEIKRLKEQISGGSVLDPVELQQIRRRAKEAQLFEEKIAVLTKELETQKTHLADIRQENSRLRLRAAETVQLAAVVKNLTAVNDNLRKSSAPDKKSLVELKKENALLKADSAALKELRQKEKLLLGKVDAHENELRQMRNQVARAELLESENSMLKKQNAELEKFDAVRKKLQETSEQLAALKSRAESAEKLKKLLLRAEARNAEKQAELDKAGRLFAASEQLKKELMAQKRENSAVRLELSRTRAGMDRLKMQMLQLGSLQRELAKHKSMSAELVSLKGLEAELAQAKLRLAEFDQIKQELARVTRYNNELTVVRQKLEKELAERGSSGERSNALFEMVSTIPAGKPEDFTASGRIAEADGSFELAIWNYEQALKIDRNHIQAAARLGRIMLDRQNYQRAVQLLSIARAADPVNIDLACSMAQAYTGLKRYGNALAVLSPLAERNGENYKVQMLLGLALAGSGDNRGAEARLRIAVRQAPAGVFAPKLELAKFLVETDVRRIEEAARIYESARVAGAAPDIDLEPKLGSRLDERREVSGFLLTAAREAEKNNDWKTAGWYYKQLVEMGREKDRYVPRLAFAMYKNGNPAGAMETLTFNRTTALGTLVAAFIQLSAKEYPAMLESARKAVALNSGKPVMIPADWSEPAVEFERLKKRHSGEMTGALRRAFRIR